MSAVMEICPLAGHHELSEQADSVTECGWTLDLVRPYPLWCRSPIAAMRAACVQIRVFARTSHG